MDVDALVQVVEKDREVGLAPFLLVATCGTTNTGNVDPMEEIADLQSRRTCGCMSTVRMGPQWHCPSRTSYL